MIVITQTAILLTLACATVSFTSSEPYPHRSFKGLWIERPIQEIKEIGSGMVALNFLWAMYQPELIQAPCSGGRVEHKGLCYNVLQSKDFYIQNLTANNIHIVAVIYGSPAWSRIKRQKCPNWAGTGSYIFCAPDDFTTYTRFLDFLIDYYGTKGTTLFDYVIWNEVQADPWFSLGGYPNTKNGPERIAAASKLYWMSYDLILSKISNARVYLSLDHTFTNVQDPPEVSGWDILDRVLQESNNRTLHVAFHPYAISVGGANFSYADRPYLTFGNLNLLLGYLQKNFVNSTVLITEVGIISNSPYNEQLQSDSICYSYSQALATPGITGYIYYQYVDIPQSELPNFKCGLVQENGRKKPSWYRWVGMDSSKPDCGFQYGNHTKVIRWKNPAGDYWVTSRDPRAYNFKQESIFWYLKRYPSNGTRPLYDCQVDVIGVQDHFLTTSNQCEGQLPSGLVGYAYIESTGPYNRPMYRCYNGKGHFVSMMSDCENAGKQEQLLGYGAN
jgi:hypothetical protein